MATDNVDVVVEKALKLLMGAGGHTDGLKALAKELLKNPKAAATIVGGLVVDHWHLGLKEVTMAAFQKNLQSIYEDNYIALKLLENVNNQKSLLDGLDDDLKSKLNDPEKGVYILKILGFDKKQIKEYQEGYSKNCVKYLNENLQFTPERFQKIEFMLNAAQCYLPFAEPHNGAVFKMPLKGQDGKYALVPMEVEKINMSPGIESDYYALNLRPINKLDPNNPDHRYYQDLIVFMGTNPLPTASGPMVTLHADTIPGKSVGENFVENSKDLFENLFIEQYKQNLINLIKNAEKPIKNYEKIWLDARVKCVGQSLGGSIPLQMLAKYPFMVEIAAFEPPLLRNDYQREIDKNMLEAKNAFSKLVDEMKLGEHAGELKKAFPDDKNSLQTKLKSNNIIITQLFDYVTKYGDTHPPATMYKVDVSKDTPTYKAIIYKAGMALTAMAHAMSVAPMTDTIIEPHGDLNKEGRAAFTSLLHNTVWKAIDPFLTKYFFVKSYLQSKIDLLNAKEHPAKATFYKTETPEMFAQQIADQWKSIQRDVGEIKQGEPSWKQGWHLKEKIDKLLRDIKRVELDSITKELFQDKNQDGIDVVKRQLKEIKYFDKTAESVLFDYAQKMSTLSFGIKIQFVSSLSQSDSTIDELKALRQQVIQQYETMGKGERMKFLEDVKKYIQSKQLLVTSPERGLLFDLRKRAKTGEEHKMLGDLIKLQRANLDQALKNSGLMIQFDNKLFPLSSVINAELDNPKISIKKLQMIQNELKSAIKDENQTIVNRAIQAKINNIDTEIKCREKAGLTSEVKGPPILNQSKSEHPHNPSAKLGSDRTSNQDVHPNNSSSKKKRV